jgi:Electron transfer flavoprotein, alpha subunit
VIDIWILAETKSGTVAPVSFELLAWARSLASPELIEVSALLPGPASDAEELCFRGADRVIHGPDALLSGYSARPLAAWIAALFARKRPTVLLAAATATGRTVLPYLAAAESLGLTADCTELALDAGSGVLLQTRPAAGGNIMATIRTAKGLPQMATVRPHSRPALARDPARPARVQTIPFAQAGSEAFKDDGLSLVEEKPFPDSRGLADARVVFSGGKGFRKKEGFCLLEPLARSIGAEVGASREAVDRGWAEYPRQVGLSGRTISPELYVAFGISGAIQHLAGMQTSGTVVSVNTDPDAPIASASDLAIRADVYEFIPALAARLRDFRPTE